MLPCSLTLLAAVNVLTVLMVFLYPVSGFVCHVRASVKTDASNTVFELVLHSVCIQFHSIKSYKCVSSDKFCLLNHLLDSSYVIGKL